MSVLSAPYIGFPTSSFKFPTVYTDTSNPGCN